MTVLGRENRVVLKTNLAKMGLPEPPVGNFLRKGTIRMSVQLEKFLLSKPEAARTLSISEKKLWSLTEPRGPIKPVRLGGRVLYSPETLRAFIRSEEERVRND